MNQSQGTAKSLEDRGLISKIKFDADNTSSPWIYYRVKENEEKGGVACENENNTLINSSNFKLRMLLSLFTLSNITINQEGHRYLKNYCERYGEELNIEDYNSYFNFINEAVQNFDYNAYSVILNKAKFTDLSYINDIGSDLKNPMFSDTPHNTTINNPEKTSEIFGYEEKKHEQGR